MKLFDIWIPQTATCQKLEAKLLRYTFSKHEIAYWKHVLHWNRKEMEKWKPRNSINSDQLCLTSTRHFWKMYRKWKFPNFQIYGFYDFFVFKSINSTKNPHNSILCTLWHNLYTKHRKRQQLFEIAYKLKYYAVLFWRVYYDLWRACYGNAWCTKSHCTSICKVCNLLLSDGVFVLSLFGIFGLCRGICNRTDSDLLFFLMVFRGNLSW